MLMILNEDETAVHGCHCQGDMDVGMCEVLAIQQCWYMCYSAKIGIAGNSPALHPLPTHLPFAPSPLNCPSPSCHLPALHPLPAHLPFTPLPPTCPSPSSCPTALHSLATHLPFTLFLPNCPSPSCHPPALHPLATHLSFIPSHSIALHPFTSQLPFTLSPPMHPTHPVEDADSETVYPVLDSRP